MSSSFDWTSGHRPIPIVTLDCASVTGKHNDIATGKKADGAIGLLNEVSSPIGRTAGTLTLFGRSQ